MLAQAYIDRVAADLLRISHFTNVDKVREVMAKIGTEMAADEPSDEVAQLRAVLDLTLSQVGKLELAAMSNNTSIEVLRGQRDAAQATIDQLTKELADARQPTIFGTQNVDGFISTQVSGLTETQTEGSDAAPTATAGAGSTDQEPAQGGDDLLAALSEAKTNEGTEAQPENN